MIRHLLRNRALLLVTLILFSLLLRSLIQMATMSGLSNSETHGVVVSGLETGVIHLLFGLMNLESKSVSMVEKMMVSFGWTSTISRMFLASGL